MQLTLGEIARALNAELWSGDPNGVAVGYSIDSRTIGPGEVFFAIRGPHFDGHDFVRAALDRRACAAVVNKKTFSEKRFSSLRSLLLVRDSVQALQSLANFVRASWNGTVVAITGSTGKTTTKELCARILASEKMTYASTGNLNNLYGLPLTLLRLNAAAEVAVVELAMSAPGEIRRLAEIAQPNIGVITNVNPVHLEFFPSVEAIAEAKRELMEAMDETSVSILNEDDLRVRAFRAFSRGRVVTFGLSEKADVRASKIKGLGLEGTDFEVRTLRETFACRLPLLGVHNVMNALAAIAVAQVFEISSADIRSALAQARPAHRRGELVRLHQDLVVVNDVYNSNPQALKKMIETLRDLPTPRREGRKVLVAGEMLELGQESERLHYDCGKFAAEARMTIVVGVQGAAQELVRGAREAGLKKEAAKFFATVEEAAESATDWLRAGDLVLLKGSRGVRMETILDRLIQAFGAANG